MIKIKEFLKQHKEKVVMPTLLVAILVFSGSSYYLGLQKGLAETKNIEITGVKGGENPDTVQADFSPFWQAWSELKARHINGARTDEAKLVQGAIKGVAGSLDDPYTTYFSPDDAKKFGDDVRGNFGGVGMEIGIKNDQLIVVSPLKDSPSERAGLKPKDKILEIDGKSTSGLQVEEAVKKIRGDIGTKVTLTMYRDAWDRPKKIEITRAVIQVPTLDSKLDDKKILHVSLYAFNENSEPLFAKAVADGMANGARGMVLDLRNDPGGYLDVAVRLAGWFLPKGSVVVRERFASGENDPMKVYGNEQLKDFPVVVLINEGSASAAEILAGALRDDRSIKLIGEKSFGKGTVQELDQLKDGGTLKITIANWLLPKGLLIDKNGIEPDYKVELTDSDIDKKIDPQLTKAIEVLNGQIAAKTN